MVQFDYRVELTKAIIKATGSPVIINIMKNSLLAIDLQCVS